MKYILIAILSLTFLKGCSQDTEEIPLELVRYLATSRGYYFEIVLDTAFIMVKNDREDTSFKKIDMPKKDWQEILELIKKIDIPELETLKTETGDSETDRAAISSLEVIYNGESYITNTFDAGNPPIAIKPLINKMLLLTERVE